MGKIITIGQQKGGVGKSTIAAHIAISLWQKGKRICLIDIDKQGSLKEWYKVREEKFKEGYTGIDFKFEAGWRIESIATKLKQEYDYIIIDSPPHTGVESTSAIRVSDLIIVPMQPSPIDLWSTKETLEYANNEDKKAIIVLNRFNPASKISKEIVSQIPHKYFKSYLGNRTAFRECFLSGMSVLETKPKSVASEEVRNLTKEILKAL